MISVIALILIGIGGLALFIGWMSLEFIQLITLILTNPSIIGFGDIFPLAIGFSILLVCGANID